MEPLRRETNEPPGFTSYDTSYEASVRIPFLFLGVSILCGKADETEHSVSFRQRDLSGTHISSLFPSQTLTVILNPVQSKKSPSKITVREAVDAP